MPWIAACVLIFVVSLAWAFGQRRRERLAALDSAQVYAAREPVHPALERTFEPRARVRAPTVDSPRPSAPARFATIAQFSGAITEALASAPPHDQPQVARSRSRIYFLPS